MDQPRLRASARALFWLIFALFTALVFEVGVRLTGLDTVALKPLLRYQHAVLPVHEVPDDPELLYELKPASRGTYAGASFSVNSLGFRDPPRTAGKPPGVVRIACLGASWMFGALVDDNETLPRHLERTLNRRFQGNFEVWNGGVNAYQVSQQAAFARRIEALYAPDLMLFNLNGASRRSFLEGASYARFFRADPRLYLENLAHVPWAGSAWGLRLLRWSALYRAAVVYANYIDAKDLPRTAFADEMNDQAWREYVARSRPGVPKVLLFLGAGRCPDPSGELPCISLYGGPDVPAGLPPEYYLVHPPGRIYRLQAQIVAQRLSELLPEMFPKRDPAARIVEPQHSVGKKLE